MNASESVAFQHAVAYADRWLGYQQQLKEIPGVVSAIGHESKAPVIRAYGYADLETSTPMTPEHIFRIASHSKTFTAVAVMQLVERGAMRLDDPIGQCVPWLEQLADGSAGRTTIRQLLNHAGGITRDGGHADFWQLEMPFPDEAGLRHLIEQEGQILPANDTFKYSNVGYSLLGLAIGAAGGTGYNEYVTVNIVDRLGMHDTGPETNEQVSGRLATAYTHRVPGFPRRPLPDWGTGAMAAATGFYSTAADLCRYATAHVLGNEELLSDASKREMQHPSWAIDGSEERYGMGLVSLKIGDRTLVGHGGSFPGHATRTLIDPNDGLVVVVLTNEANGPARTLATTVVKIVNLALSRAPSDVPASCERFTGRFLTMWGVTDIVQLGEGLYMLSPELDDPTVDVTEVEVLDDETLRISATGGYGSLGQTVRYERDDTGAITAVTIAGLTAYPEDTYRTRLRGR